MATNKSIFSIDNETKLQYDPIGVKIPNFDDDESQIKSHWFNAFGVDLSDMDLSVLGDKIKYMHFDDKTIFPSADKLPNGFDPHKIFEDGKDPGLNIRDLHNMGITGKGIIVAILDNGLGITEHQEIKDNLIHHEIIGATFSHYHGLVCASLLCGKTTGVAPDAKLVYFSTGFGPVTIDENGKEHFSAQNDIMALRKILAMNAELPDDKKISAVSISRGWYFDTPESEEFNHVITQLIESGVFVLTTNAHHYYGPSARFITTDRNINSDPNDIKSYVPGFWRAHEKYPMVNNLILSVAGNRTAAGPEAPNYYMHFGANSGMSWATPYMVGGYALAKQVYPQLTPMKFFEITRQTGCMMELSDGRKNILIQPKKIIEQLQQELILQQTKQKEER